MSFGTLQAGHGLGGLSIVLACEALPALLVLAEGVTGGDRIRRHLMMAGTEILAVLTWTAIAACLLTGATPLSMLSILALLAGLACALFLPAERAIIADLAHHDTRRIGNALMSQAVSGVFSRT
ncbi:MFS transporter [Actinomadura rubrisoli]|uniref:MFS transporter n=1 Tax=Actinomadura rubrisoli TaxID=2530368 RepID=UPI0014045016|nr:MFS transporter [Actinomadura rubrisoli]